MTEFARCRPAMRALVGLTILAGALVGCSGVAMNPAPSIFPRSTPSSMPLGVKPLESFPIPVGAEVVSVTQNGGSSTDVTLKVPSLAAAFEFYMETFRSLQYKIVADDGPDYPKLTTGEIVFSGNGLTSESNVTFANGLVVVHASFI